MRSEILVVIATLAAPSLALRSEQVATDQLLEMTYTEMSARTANDYLEVRKRMLGFDKRQTTTFLETKREAATDVFDKLLIQALLAHVKDPGRLESQLELARQVATQPVSMRWGLDKNPLPRPNQVAGALLHEFGSDAMAFATEMLLKKVTQDWDPWKKEVPIRILSAYGRSIEHFPRTAEMRYGDVKDPRAGRVLLWVVENSDDDKIAALATQSLYLYATPELIAQAKTAHQRAQAQRRKERLGEAIATMDAMQRSVEENARYWATRPSSAPATQP